MSVRPISVLALLASVLLGALIYPFLAPFFFAGALAVAAAPLRRRLLDLLGQRRRAAAILLTFGLAAAIIAPLIAAGTTIATEFDDGIAFIDRSLKTGRAAKLLRGLPRPMAEGVKEPIEEARKKADEPRPIAGMLVVGTEFAVNLAILLIAFFFLIEDGDRLVDWLCRSAPLPEGQLQDILLEVRDACAFIVRSLLTSALLQAVSAGTGFFLAGAPNPFFFSFLVFVAAIVPLLGSFVVSLMVAGLLFLAGDVGAAVFLALWSVIVVAFVENVVTPWLIKDRTRLHGGLVFFSLVGGIAAFGAAGLIAGPLALSFFNASVRLYRRGVDRRSQAA